MSDLEVQNVLCVDVEPSHDLEAEEFLVTARNEKFVVDRLQLKLNKNI